MRIKILKIQKSSRPIVETKLSKDGPVTLPSDEESYEMRLDIYYENGGSLPEKTMIISPQFHADNIAKYGMEALLKGVDLISALSITEKYGSKHDTLGNEANAIAYSIVARMEQNTFFNHYDPKKMQEYISSKILGLKDKFNITLK